MTGCSKRREQIVDLLENHLSDSARAELLDHIKHCPECAREYKQLNNLNRIMDGDIVQYPSQDTFERMKSAARQRAVFPKSRVLRRFFKVSVPAFAVVVILFLMLQRRVDTVDMSIPVAHLLEDEEIAEIAVTGVVNADLVREIEFLEEQLYFETDEAIEELSKEQRNELVSSLRRRYTVGT